jgi:hypothetical protein
MNMIKIGPLYLNLDHVAEIRDTGVDIEVFYQGSDKATTLRGVEAERLRQWLESVSRDLNKTA